MNREQIINEIAHAKDLPNICRKVAKGDDRAKDLFQHLILNLLEMPDEKLFDIYNRGNLRVYCLGFVYRSWYSKTSTFGQMYQHAHYHLVSDSVDIGKMEAIRDEQFIDNQYDDEPYKLKDARLAMYKIADDNTEKTYHDLLDKVDDQVTSMSADPQQWYDAKLLQIYSEVRSVRKMSKEIGIPYKSIHNSIQQAKCRIKENLRD